MEPVYAEDSEYYETAQNLWSEWEQTIEERWEDDSVPMSISRVVASLRDVLPREGIVACSAGQPQETVEPEFPVYHPRTNISCGGFSTMGFGVSAAIGAKLASPDRPVVDVEGDGSFLMCNQELGCAVEHDVDVTYLVVNNSGWTSIRNLQVDKYGWDRVLDTEFDEEKCPDFVRMAESFNLGFAERVVKPENLDESLQAAINHDGPALVEAVVEGDNADSGAVITGKWDLADLENK
jgi:acetolactate synthase-1/2/3 large subunit